MKVLHLLATGDNGGIESLVVDYQRHSRFENIYVSSTSFPVVAFILVSVLAFVTGDSWGVPAICVPIIMPLGTACGANVLLTMGAVVSGGVFCSHACFYSVSTVLTSTCCEMDAMTHARTQLPYELIAFVICMIMYLLFGVLF